MIYVITDSQSEGRTMLIKAESEEEVNRRLKISETHKVVGRLTDSEMRALNDGSFCVITA